MHILFFLLTSFGFSFASVLKVELLRDLVDSGNDVELFYNGLNFSFGRTFSVAYSAYKYDPDCVTVHRTNSMFYVGCHLPRKCGTPVAHVFDKNLFGQETVLCYSFHEKFKSKLRYSEFDLSHFDIDLTHPFSRNSLRYLNAVRPVTLDKNFYLLFNSSYVALLPKICTMFFPSRVDFISSFMTIEGDRDEVCVEIPSNTRMDCHPRWFFDLGQLMKHYNYPVSYAGAPNDGDESLDTNLNGALALYDLLREQDNYTLVSHRGGRYFASFFPLDSAITVIPLRFPPEYEEKLCLHVDSAYTNPFSTMFHYVMSQLEYILEEVLNVLSDSIDEILIFLLRLIVKVIDVVLEMIPYSNYFLTSCFSFLLFEFYLSNLYQSTMLSVILYFLQIYINSSINN
nr:hypothetical protein 3 [ssRNA positive-strand virus sp.]